MYSLGFVKSITFGIPSFNPTSKTLPDSFSLKEELGQPIDQGDRGICVSVCVTEIAKYRYNFKGSKYRKREDFYYNHRSDKRVDGMSPRNAFEIAQRYNILSSFATLKNLKAVKAAIVANGPVLIGLPVYSYNSDFWRKTAEKPIGYHATLLVGYDDIESEFYLRNSWGTNWGLEGYTAFPYLELGTALEVWTAFS